MLFTRNRSYAKSLAILVVGLAGGHLTTDTRFQKIAFLVDREVLGSKVKFEPREFGPYSDELEKVVGKLVKEHKLLRVRDNSGVVHYYLTRKGEEELGLVMTSIGEDKVRRAKDIVERFKDSPLDYILAYVYSKYEEYALRIDAEVLYKFEEWRKKYNL